LVLPRLAHLDAARQEKLLSQLVRVEWLGEATLSADEALKKPEPDPAAEGLKDQAAAWLRRFLRHGPRPSSECVRSGNEANRVTKSQKWWRDSILKKMLGGEAQKVGFGAGQYWTFVLPPRPPREESEGAEGAEESRVRETGGLGSWVVSSRPRPWRPNHPA